MNVSLNPKTTVYVGGLEKNINEAILHAAFIPFGDIKDVNIPLDQTTQENRGFGFVTYLEKEEIKDGLINQVCSLSFDPLEFVWADADSYMEKQIQDEEYKDAVLEEEYGLQNKAADSKGD
eukprot:gene6940-8279_t